jgi:hypothetical protein
LPIFFRTADATSTSLDYFDDYEEYDYQENAGGSCPKSPLYEDNWDAVCQKKADDKADFTTVAPTPKPEKKARSNVVRKAKGPGSNLGLSFVVDDMPCGWLRTGTFDGSRVSLFIQCESSISVHGRHHF